MDDAIRRRLIAGSEPEEDPEPETRNFSDQLAAGYAGVQALQASSWEAPADLAWTDAEKDDWHIDATVDEHEARGVRSKLLIAAAGIFLLALVPRLIFLFGVTDPGVVIPTWSNDTFHRWQIAYLSKEIGFHEGFLRLWDLKGLEYFWGILHPVLLAASFYITGSVDIMIPRLLSLVAGCLNIVFLYLLGAKYWSKQVGLAIAVVTALNPIVIFNDPSGMVEPFGFVFILAGIYFYPSRSFVAGLMFGLGAMARAEGWLFSIGLIAAAMLGREESDRKLGLALGWLIPMLLYMRYLFVWTGNPIFPVYWNFLANAAGEWIYRETYTSYQLAARPVLIGAFLVSLGGALWVLWKRPRAYLLHLLGLGTTAFITGFIGLTAYLTGYETWFWLTRFFVFTYIYVGILVVVLFMDYLPKKNSLWRSLQLGWAATGAIFIGMQFTWIPVLYDVHTGYTYQPSRSTLEEHGMTIAGAYRGGVVLIPEDNPQLTYAVVRYGGIEADELQGQMYTPMYYFDGDPLQNWDVIGPEMWEWLEKEEISLLVFNRGDERFVRLMEDRPQNFMPSGVIPNTPLGIYEVKYP